MLYLRRISILLLPALLTSPTAGSAACPSGQCRAGRATTRIEYRMRYREIRRFMARGRVEAIQAAPQSPANAPPTPSPQAPTGDIVSDVNALRARYGLPPVGHDANLAAWAGVNNAQQHGRGMGHHAMGEARRQNVAMAGSYHQAWSMWLSSPAHFAAITDPDIRAVGIAGSGPWWTFNAR